MNKDDFEYFRRLKSLQPTPSNPLDLLKGIEIRELGLNKKNATIKGDLELFAEEQLIRKNDFDEMRCEMPGQPRSTFLMVFSPDGSRVASTHGNHNIYVTDLRSGKHIRTLVGHPRTPWCIAFHPTSNQIVASGCLGGQVRIWDLSGGSEIWTAENQTVIASLAFHPSDRVLVIATYNEVYFWDWSRPEPFAHVATSNAKEKVRYVAFDSLGQKLITGIANSPQTRWERVRAPVPIAHQGPGANSYRRRITQRLQNPPAPENTSTPPAPRDVLSSVPERERRITVCYRNLVREYEQLVHRYLRLYRPPIMIDRGTDPMEPNVSTHNQSIDLTRSSPDCSGPSTSGLNTSDTQQDEGTSDRISNETVNTTETQRSSNTNTQEDPRSITSNSNIKSQSLLTPSKIFSVLSKPSVLIQGTQTTESRKHKSETSSSELPHEKRFKSSSSDTNDSRPCTSGMTTNPASSAGPSRVDGVFQTNEDSVTVVKENTTINIGEPSGPSTPHKSLQKAGSSAFTEPFKTRATQEKRHRNSEDDSPSNRNQVASPSSDQSTSSNSKTCLAPSNGPSLNGPSSSRSDSTSNVQKTPNSPEQPREKRFKSSEDSESLNEVRYSSNSPGNSKSTENSSRNQGKYSAVNSAKLNPPPSYNTTMSHANSSQGQRDCSFRIRIPLERERSSDINDNNVANDTGRDNQQPSNSTAASTSSGSGQRRSLPVKVGDLLCDIRRTAEEEVRNRILPIIRSVPPNDRPELIRLFENSRENVRMRFRHIYPMFSRKTNRRILNIDTSSDNSSSDEESNNSSNSRHVRRNSEPASSAGNTPTSRDSTANVQNVSSTNAATSNPNVATSITSSGTVRNFNTELEQLVTTLLNEIERNDECNNRTSEAITSSNGTTQTNRTISVPVGDALSDNSGGQTTTVGADWIPSSIFPLANVPSFQQASQEDSPIEGTSSPSVSGASASAPHTSESTTFTSNTFTTSSRIGANQYNCYAPRRRRLFPCRISAFMPTRVNCFRPPPRLRRTGHIFRGRLVTSSNLLTPSTSSTFDLDQLINYSERENSEDESTQQPLDLSNHPNEDNPELDNVYSNIRLGNVYSNIIQDLESSLNDVIRMRASNRPGETSDMLGSFSERLESIMNQSDTILRNLSNSMEMIGSAVEPGRQQSNEPRLSFFDQDFYVRDQRNDNSLPENNRDNTINLSDIFNAVAADHTYPRNPDLARTANQGEGLSPLMTSIHMTISHIQRQARLLRQQVESIERIDRAMLEVAQLQLIRHLNVDLVRYLRSPNGESRSTGMSSVRQMMAGTRISDSSPYESPAEDSQTTQDPNPTPSSPSSSTSNTGGLSSSGTSNNWNQPPRPRSSHRKTYPPGKIYRMSRHCRKPPIFHFFSRRYTNRNDRNSRQPPPTRLPSRLHEPSTSSFRQESHPNYTYINTYTLSSMATRLENLLREQMRVFTTLQARPTPSPPNNRSSSMVDLGEHILATRLHGCVVRVNRLLENNQTVRSDSSAAVTQDGESRYGARHTLSTIIESMSRYLEEVGNSNIPQSIKVQIHSVLVMALLLTELLLLVIVDSIPPPSGINLIPERAFLTSRIDHMCNQMLQSRNFNLSHQLTRSLRLMKLTMRHAHRLGQSYHARRNAMLPRNNLERRQLVGSINRCLRTINRRRQPTDNQNLDSTTEDVNSSPPDTPEPSERPEQADTTEQQPSASTNIHEWYSTLIDVLSLYRLNRTNRSSNSDQNPNRSSNTEREPSNESNRNSNPPEPNLVEQFLPNRDSLSASDPVRDSSELTRNPGEPPRDSSGVNSNSSEPNRDSNEQNRGTTLRRSYYAFPRFTSREPNEQPNQVSSETTRRGFSDPTRGSSDPTRGSSDLNRNTTEPTLQQMRESYRRRISGYARYIAEPNRSTIEPTSETDRDANRSESSRQRLHYRFPFLTWNRERSAAARPNREPTSARLNREPNSGSVPWRGGDSRDNRLNRLFNNLRDTVGQQLSSANDNSDGDDTDDTESYHSNNSPQSQNAPNQRVAPGPPRMMRFLNVPSVQVNDVPVPVSEPLNFSHRLMTQRQRFAERVSELRSNPNLGLFRPRFLHPLYASVNPFDADLDDPQREQIYDSDMITTVTPNHRIQAWDVSDWNVPAISNALKNVVVGECKIHNDASVDVAKDGTILVTLLPSGGYLNVTNRLGVYSLKWETLGQCLYTTSFDQNAVSVSLSPLSRHLVVGLTHRIITSERWVMARIFKIPKDLPGDRLPVLRELEQSRDSRINCIRWLPVSGQGLIYATNTGQLVILS